MAEALKHIPLEPLHSVLGAQWKEFGGYNMPVRYAGGGDIKEHQAVRERVGLFDVSHMGRVHLRGKDALSFINNMVTYDIAKVSPEQVRYTVMCNPDGGIIDDLLVYPTKDPQHIALVVNAGNRTEDLSWLRQHQSGFEVEIEDVTEATGLIAVQGPEALSVVKKLTPSSFVPPAYYHFTEGVSVAGADSLVSRTGYTGEDGVEIWCDKGYLEGVWSTLMDAGRDLGILACGLGARDSLRLEAGFPLHGHEITANTNPFESGLSWVVSMDKDDFIGKDALSKTEAEGISRKLVGFRTSGRGENPRQGQPVLYDGEVVGSMVSGVYSPTFERGIGTGFILPELVRKGNEFQIDIRGKLVDAELVSPPRFYRRKAAA